MKKKLAAETQEKDTTYNGWKNYETWALNLHMSNEQSSQSYWSALARETYAKAEKDQYFTKAERAAVDFSHVLEHEIKDDAPDLGCSMYADLLNAALSEVNWYEIAKCWIEDVAREGGRDE